MEIEKYIYDVLSASPELDDIYNGNVQPLSAKKNKLPVILYQLIQIGSETGKTKGELKGEYILKLHLFSEVYTDITSSSDICKELFDFKEIIEDDVVVIDLIKFIKYSNEYEESGEVFNRTLEFSLDIY